MGVIGYRVNLLSFFLLMSGVLYTMVSCTFGILLSYDKSCSPIVEPKATFLKVGPTTRYMQH